MAAFRLETVSFVRASEFTSLCLLRLTSEYVVVPCMVTISLCCDYLSQTGICTECIR